MAFNQSDQTFEEAYDSPLVVLYFPHPLLHCALRLGAFTLRKALPNLCGLVKRQHASSGVALIIRSLTHRSAAPRRL